MSMLARIAALTFAGLTFTAGTALADGTVAVTEPWARAGTPAARSGAAFMTIKNGGTEADRLVGAETPVAEKAELHTHLMDNGVMKMREVDAIELPPGESVALRPGGLHVMLMGLKQPLTQGGRFPVTLTFAKAGAVTVEVPIQSAGAMGPSGMGAGGMGAGGMEHGGTGHGAMHQQMHGEPPKQGQ
ncbi:copper chaperone PCu(A)C [Azospirillum soli]|uniref:copper chaperone PCu(A)C n=1 Tax=Azospirillum soli TaxID=1304799 RepID=UPI001AE375EF|nr:copper chaperone PCu(A)C [Azospirillum soli]MBP2311844.1 copper(I)-binding protein [Azospirillum soli]